MHVPPLYHDIFPIGDNLLGTGEYGTVYKALAHRLPTVVRGPTVVAVKTLLDNAGSEQQSLFAEEFKVMIKAGNHVNIVSLLGIVQAGDYS